MTALFINEAYYKKVISHVRAEDEKKILSTIRLVQQTDLKGILTDVVYEAMETKIVNGDTLTVGEESLYKDMQLYLAVKSALEISYSSPTRDDYVRDTASLTYKSKSSLLEARMVRAIKNDPDLLALAVSDPLGFDDTEMNNQGGFYFD